MAKILLVDDDDLLRKMLRLTLARMGHVVIEARDGNEALQHCRAELPDLVITDVIMPGKEGLETIGELRRVHPAVKVIAMSGGGRVMADDYLKIAKLMGAASTLAKPFSAESLAAEIATVLGTGPSAAPPGPTKP